MSNKVSPNSKVFGLTNSRKFPQQPKNVKSATKTLHHAMNPIRPGPPLVDTTGPDVNVGCFAPNLPINVLRLRISLTNEGILCTGITRKANDVYVIHTNGDDDYVISTNGGITKLRKRKFKKSRKIRKSRKIKKKSRSRY